MADVRSLLQRCGVDQKQRAAVEAKANEYARISTARMGVGALGQGELCKGAACMELACMTLGVAVDAAQVARFSGVGERVYRNAKAALQKVLGVTSKTTARELCVQFGCAGHEPAVRAALAAYKDRFVRSLPAAQQRHVDFGRPVFLAAAFYLVARKKKVAVDRVKLLDPLGVTAAELAQACASMANLCHDLVGCEPRKRRAEELPAQQRALIDRTGAASDGDEASSSEDEVEDDGQVGYRINAKKQRQREYDDWKQKVLTKPQPGTSTGGGASSSSAAADAPGAAAAAAGGGGGGRKQKLTEKKLRQAVLSFAAAAGAAAAAEASPNGGTGEPAAAAPEQQAAAGGADKGKAAKQGGSGQASRKAPLASRNS